MLKADKDQLLGIMTDLSDLVIEAEAIIERQPIDDVEPGPEPEPGEPVVCATAEEFKAALDDPAVAAIELAADIEGEFKLRRGPLTITGANEVPAGRIATDATVPTLRGQLLIEAGSGITMRRFRFAPGRLDTLVSFQPGTSDVLLEQMILDGENTGTVKRGIRADAANTTIRQSSIWAIWKAGQDSQAICAWDTPGPITIVDNFLEAASENIMFGGADPAVPGTTPSDILVEGNDISKRDEWREWGAGGSDPRMINVKNLFEIKTARRVVVRRNRFRGCWTDGQTGTAILLKSANQGGKNPQAICAEVEIYENEIRDAINGISFLGMNYNHVTERAHTMTIRDNLWELSTVGKFVLMGGGTKDVTIDHNTVIHHAADGFTKITRGKYMEEEGQPTVTCPPHEGFRFTNNLVWNGRRYNSTPDKLDGYGLWAEEGGSNGLALGGPLLPDTVCAGNVIAGIGTQKHGYPIETNKVDESEEQFFANLPAPDYYLVEPDPYPGVSTDGTPVGRRRVPASAA